MSKVNKELLGELLKDQRIRMGYSLEDKQSALDGEINAIKKSIAFCRDVLGIGKKG